MKTGRIVFVLTFAAVLGLAGPAPAAEEDAPKGKPQTVCPIMKWKINRNLYADYKGYRVYLCCPDCLKVFWKEPQKYIKMLQDEGVEVTRVPGQ